MVLVALVNQAVLKHQWAQEPQLDHLLQGFLTVLYLLRFQTDLKFLMPQYHLEVH